MSTWPELDEFVNYVIQRDPAVNELLITVPRDLFLRLAARYYNYEDAEVTRPRQVKNVAQGK